MWIIIADKGKPVTVLNPMNCSHPCGKESGLPFHYLAVDANEFNTNGRIVRVGKTKELKSGHWVSEGKY